MSVPFSGLNAWSGSEASDSRTSSKTGCEPPQQEVHVRVPSRKNSP